MQRFGDERVAAKLIRRAKRRGRPVLWHVWNFLVRATVTLTGIYVLLIIRFCISRPSPSVNYIDKINGPIASTLPGDRAWPLWRKAIVAIAERSKDGQLVQPKAIWPSDPPRWAEKVAWLNQHTAALNLIREAAAKPVLGFVLGQNGAGNDAEIFGPYVMKQQFDAPMITLLLPHLNMLRMCDQVLSFDAHLATELNDRQRLKIDLQSMLGIVRQLQGAEGSVVTQLVALGASESLFNRLQMSLQHNPNIFDDDQLIKLAHIIAGPRTAADLIQLQTERYTFHDTVQRLFTDDGNGNGRMTLKGMRILPAPLNFRGNRVLDPWDDIYGNTYALASPLPMATVSRQELVATYDRIMDQVEANFHLPLRQVDLAKINEQIDALKDSRVDQARYGALLQLIPDYSKWESMCERSLGERDGTLVGISLELYKRRFGHYPDKLNELTPDLLPVLPPDRITGDPLRYRLIKGKPIVYSVGIDRVDDGGCERDESRQTRSLGGSAVAKDFWSSSAWRLDYLSGSFFRRELKSSE